MTLKELSKYHDLKVELDDLSGRINELELTLIKAAKYSDMKVDRSFNNTSPTEEVAIKINKLKDLEESLKQFKDLKIEAYFDYHIDNEGNIHEDIIEVKSKYYLDDIEIDEEIQKLEKDENKKSADVTLIIGNDFVF